MINKIKTEGTPAPLPPAEDNTYTIPPELLAHTRPQPDKEDLILSASPSDAPQTPSERRADQIANITEITPQLVDTVFNACEQSKDDKGTINGTEITIKSWYCKPLVPFLDNLSEELYRELYARVKTRIEREISKTNSKAEQLMRERFLKRNKGMGEILSLFDGWIGTTGTNHQDHADMVATYAEDNLVFVFKDKCHRDSGEWMWFDATECKWQDVSIKTIMGRYVRFFEAEMRKEFARLKDYQESPDSGKGEDWLKDKIHGIESNLSKLKDSNFQRGIINALRTLEDTDICKDQFDQAKHLLAFENGVYDLSKAKFRREEKEDYISRRIQVDYDLEAKCPLWESTVLDHMSGEQGRVDYLQKIYGLALSGNIKHHLFAFFYGAGRNGKSLQLNTIQGLLAEFSCTAPEGLYTKSGRNNKVDPDRIFQTISGYRLTIGSEVASGKSFSEDLIKSLTSGDTVSRRLLYGEVDHNHQPTASLILQGNHKLKITEFNANGALMRRFVPFHFRENYSGREDVDLPQKLRKESAGIINWLIDGYHRAMNEGMNDLPQEIITEKEEYTKDQDHLGRFILDILNFDLNTENTEKKKDVWEAYQDWMDDEGADKFTLTKFNFFSALKERGIATKRHMSKGEVFVGVSLTRDNDYDADGLEADYFN